MSIQPSYEKLCIKESVGDYSTHINVECKTGVSSEKIARVLNSQCKVTSVGNEITDGNVKFSGRCIFTVTYETDAGTVAKCECGSEFSGAIENNSVKSGENCRVSFTAERTDVNLFSGIMTVSAIIRVDSHNYCEKFLDAVNGGENVIFKTCEIPVCKRRGEKRGSFPITEEFELNYNVCEVLSHSCEAVLTAVQCGIGSVIVDGEAYLSLCVLQNREKNDIVKETKIIPFRFELESDDTVPTMSATAFAEEKATKLDVIVDEETGKSTVSATLTVEITGEAYENSYVSVAADLYSSTNETDAVVCGVKCANPAPQRSAVKKFEGRSASQSDAGSAPVCALNEKAAVTCVKNTENGADIDLVVSANVLMKDPDGKLFSVSAETPVSLSVDSEFPLCETRIAAAVRELKVKVVSSEEIELSGELCLFITSSKLAEYNVITSVTEGKRREPNDCAVSVYIPSEKEDLWTVSKKMNACPEVIMELNPELQFPLTGKERIVIFRQLSKEF